MSFVEQKIDTPPTPLSLQLLCGMNSLSQWAHFRSAANGCNSNDVSRAAPASYTEFELSSVCTDRGWINGRLDGQLPSSATRPGLGAVRLPLQLPSAAACPGLGAAQRPLELQTGAVHPLAAVRCAAHQGAGPCMRRAPRGGATHASRARCPGDRNGSSWPCH